MGWLRNIFSNLVRFFSWTSNFFTLFWNLLAKMFATVWGKFLVLFCPALGIIYGLYYVWSRIIRPVRQWFIDGGEAGFQSGDWPIASLIGNMVTAINYVFPLDELLQIGIFMLVIILGISAVLAILRLVKTIIGGWI